MDEFMSLDKNLWILRIFRERRHMAPSLYQSFRAWLKDFFNAR